VLELVSVWTESGPRFYRNRGFFLSYYECSEELFMRSLEWLNQRGVPPVAPTVTDQSAESVEEVTFSGDPADLSPATSDGFEEGVDISLAPPIEPLG